MNISQLISEEIKVNINSVTATLLLLKEGNTVPFISRYRKEATGNLSDDLVHNIEALNKQYIDLQDRKQTVLASIDEQGKLSNQLKQKINECIKKQALEDLYLPYKQKRKTKASVAIEQGLKPLADIIIRQKELSQSKQDTLKKFINPEKGISTFEKALNGALDIVAQLIAENSYYRGYIRKNMQFNAQIVTKVKKEYAEQKTRFDAYYNHTEKLSKIPAHRLLAIKRAETEKIISWKLELDHQKIINYLKDKLLINIQHPFADNLKLALKDSYKRLIFPSLENECFNEKLELSYDESINVFSKNLKNLLLSAPVGNKSILGVDPGFRTGCKLALINETGQFKQSYNIYPNEPQNKVAEAEKITLDAIIKFRPQIIAIGNGTASKETFSFIKNIIKKHRLEITPIVVSESGASVYSASETARQEFPELDVTIRGAISIARRLQDPLAELVKIDPKSIGVGQYQHDVNQKKLKDELSYTVESCVNHVGVDVNTASAPLLSYVAGIGATIAKNVIEYRNNNLKIKSRKELLRVAKLGPKAYEQCAGFLRVKDSNNPLDNSAIHPESYKMVKTIADDLNIAIDKLIGNQEIINQIDLSKYVTEKVGLPTLNDLKNELLKPGLDPRKEFSYADFDDDIDDIKDLKKEMVLQGVVTNVTNFGAFVDVGVHQDGLVHISQLSDSFVTDPYSLVSVGDKISVSVIDVDVERKRISLKKVL